MTPGSSSHQMPLPGGYAVRAARAEDRAGVAAFRARVGADAPASNAEVGFDDESGLWVWLAEDTTTGAVVGAVTLERVSTHAAQMSGLSVAPELRGRGIGGRLVRAALKHCNDNGLIKVMLDALGEQTVAIGLFQRFGFRLSRTRQISGRESMEFYLDLYRKAEGGGEQRG